MNLCLVTGATSTIGRYIVNALLEQGRQVRIISRKDISSWDDHLEVVQGDLRCKETLAICLKGVDCVFHCAAEFHDQETLWDVNVCVTEHLIEKVRQQKIDYFCHISSAGVLGACTDAWVDESTACYPRDLYEKSKYVAEQCVMASRLDARVCVLRPVFVVSPERPGFVQYPIRNNWKDRLMVYFKGREQAHLIHARDVASAAIFFMSKDFHGSECFYVSCDEDEMNTVGGIYACYRSLSEGNAWPEKSDIPCSAPRLLPHLIRFLLRGPSLHGRVRFSSSRLNKFGFTLPMGFRGALEDIRASQKK